MIRRAWCKACLWAVDHWPVSTQRPWSYSAFLSLLPWAGEEAYRDEGP
jgi:hypothetical protein